MNGRANRLYAQLVRSASELPAVGAVFLFCTVTHGVAHGIMALAAGALVRGLALGPMDGRSTFGVGSLALACIGVISALGKLATNVGAAHTRATLVSHTVERVRCSVLEARLRGHMRHPGQEDHGASSELAAPRPARELASLTTHVREVEVGLDQGVLRALRSMAELVPVLVALVVVDAKLAAGAVVVLAPFAWALSRLRRGLKTRQARALRESEALLAAADDAVTYADLFRVFRAEDRARGTLRALAARIAEASRFVTTRAALLSSGNEVLGALALLVVVAGSSLFLPAERAALVPFSVVFFLAYKPIRDFSDGRVAWSKGEAALDAIASSTPLADDVGAPVLVDGGDPPPSFALDSLVLEALLLPHSDVPTLDLTIAAGEIVGIVAPTGTGKTTLFRVLLGLEPPASGVVRYGARALASSDGPGARPFAWAPQDAPLVAGSVTENVALGATADAKTNLDIEANAALAAVGATDLTLADRDVLRGTRALSGGERQWVGLARALAAGRPVLLLDEPTNGLDAASQARVLGALRSLRGKHTVLFATHRRDALLICDRVLDLERGTLKAFSIEP